MIQINTSEGKTLNFDITEKAKRDELKNLLDDPNFIPKVTGIGILHRGEHYIHPVPKDMRISRVVAEPLIKRKEGDSETIETNDAELTGEQLSIYLDELRLTLTVWYQKTGPKVSTFEVKRLGKNVFSP